MTRYIVKASVEFIVKTKNEKDAWQQADNHLGRAKLKNWLILYMTREAESN